MQTISVSSSFTPTALSLIKEKLSDYIVIQVNEWDKAPKHSAALLIRSSDRVTSKLLNNFENLKVIASATSGFDHFDLETIKENSKISFCYSPEANKHSAAELTLFHALSLFKKSSSFTQTNPKWKSSSMMSTEIFNKKIGIVGFGRIGSLVCSYFKALGCQVFVYDPYVSSDKISNAGATALDFEQILKKADLVTLHCPLTKKTNKLINKDSLSTFNSHSFLINAARGKLVCSTGLTDALREGLLKGAALDVFEQEPLSMSSSLRKLPQLYWSPHIGAYTDEAQKKSALEAAQQVKNVFEQSQPVLSLVPPNVKWAKDL